MPPQIHFVTRIGTLVSSLAAFALSNPVLGHTFDLAMTCTVTTSNDPNMLVGTVFQNLLWYDSPTVDGSFYTNPNGVWTDDPGQQLFGKILDMGGGTVNGRSESFYFRPDISYGFGVGDFMSHQLTVTSGVVSDFWWDGQSGWGNSFYNETNFSFYLGGPDIKNVRGTVQFSEITESVPDSGMNFALLGGAFIGLAALRRRIVA